MRKNQHGKILRWEPKEQHLSLTPYLVYFPKKKKIINFFQKFWGRGAKAPPLVLKWLRHYLKLFSVSSKDQLVDIFTKSHPKGCLHALLDNLKLVSHPP